MITRDDVLKAAALARLSLREEEVARLVGDLERIVAHVDTLMDVDLSDLEPMTRAADDDRGPALRPDVPGEILGRRALEGGPGFDGALVRVPKVLD